MNLLTLNFCNHDRRSFLPAFHSSDNKISYLKLDCVVPTLLFRLLKGTQETKETKGRRKEPQIPVARYKE